MTKKFKMIINGIICKVSPNVLYEIQIPEEEQFSGCISESTKNLMQEKIVNWEPAESQTGMEHHLGMQTVPDKTVADCVEALIGVYLTVSTKKQDEQFFSCIKFTFNSFILIIF